MALQVEATKEKVGEALMLLQASESIDELYQALDTLSKFRQLVAGQEPSVIKENIKVVERHARKTLKAISFSSVTGLVKSELARLNIPMEYNLRETAGEMISKALVKSSE